MKKRTYFSYPYIIWSFIFIVVPLLMILFFSFTKKIGSDFVFSTENFNKLIDPMYYDVFERSLTLAAVSTILCFIIGYPVAYIISKMKPSKRNIVILLFILPMWMNFLLRTYSWMSILGSNGILNQIITAFGFKPVELLYTDGAVLLGMVYNFLPFMVLPIYTVLIKMDQDVINAAHDLGANSAQVFRRVILPLSMPGVMSGITMVFMPAVSTFVISRILGGGKYSLIGNLIEHQFTFTGDWNFGSSISVVMMIIMIILMAILSMLGNRMDKEGGIM